MKLDSRSMMYGIGWCVVLIALATGYWSLRRDHQQLLDARLQLQQCEKIAEEIQALKTRPGFAALGVDSPRTITARAEAAGQQANIQPTALVRIEPQSAVRLRDSPYRLRPTRLELRRVTLQQVVEFTHAMIDEAQGTTVRDLRLSLSEATGELAHGDDAKEVDLWTAELVLTQLIYSPLR